MLGGSEKLWRLSKKSSYELKTQVADSQRLGLKNDILIAVK